jgi:hypothetical protein
VPSSKVNITALAFSEFTVIMLKFNFIDAHIFENITGLQVLSNEIMFQLIILYAAFDAPFVKQKNSIQLNFKRMSAC